MIKYYKNMTKKQKKIAEEDEQFRRWLLPMLITRILRINVSKEPFGTVNEEGEPVIWGCAMCFDNCKQEYIDAIRNIMRHMSRKEEDELRVMLKSLNIQI